LLSCPERKHDGSANGGIEENSEIYSEGLMSQPGRQKRHEQEINCVSCQDRQQRSLEVRRQS